MHSSQKLFTFCLFTLVLVLSLNSCRLIEDIVNPPTTGPDTTKTPPPPTVLLKDSMSLKINGVFYRPRSLGVLKTPFNQIIRGSEPDLVKAVALTIPLEPKPGTYPLQRLSQHVAQYNPSFNISPLLDGGTLVILKYDSKTRYIEGTFEFTATDVNNPNQFVYNITEGYLRMTLK